VTDRTGGDPAGVVGGLVDVGEDRPYPVEVGAAGVGEVDPTCGAVEQNDAEFAIELPDRVRERRLCHVEPLGCTPEVALFRDGDEVAELAQIHRFSISIHVDIEGVVCGAMSHLSSLERVGPQYPR
jgi:hypothetical protein